MYQIDFEKPQKVHFIGIGGISMSGLAEILLKAGFTVSGSDLQQNALTKRLETLGARVSHGQYAQNITDDVDLAVYTAAVHPDNPEYAEALRRGILLMSRAELLGGMMANFRQSLAVAGTHGKTTATSMAAEILMAAGLDPTVSVGGILPSIGGNIRVGDTGLFVAEACEYTNSFLSFSPTIEIILNIELDHIDFFKDIEDVRHSFRLFAQKLPEDGALVIDSGILRLHEITEGLACRVVTVGLGEGSDYRAEDISYDELARAAFTLVKHGKPAYRVTLGVPGEHNVSNALAAAAACEMLGASSEAVQEGLASFGGVRRRFEKKGVLGGVTIIDDYAHHPQEIAATLKTARQYPHRKLWCIFQPHTYSRTKALMDEFAEALTAADEVVLADIYPARETDSLGISSQDLARRIQELGGHANYFPTFDDIETFILKNCIHNDLLITMGAGDVVKIGDRLLGR